MRKLFTLPLLLLLAFATTANAQSSYKVLAELFTNTNCGNCRVPEENFEGFLTAHPEFGVVRIVYHNEITNPDDIFYVPAITDVNAREQKYGLNSNPLGIIDGYPLGNNEPNWESAVAAASTQAFPVQIAVTVTPQLDNMWNVHVTLTGNLPKQARLYVALTEDKIIYDNKLAYGNPSSGQWDDIFRAMISGANGTDAFTLSGTKEFDFSADFTDQDWVSSNVHVVAFVQDLQQTAPSSFQVEGLTKAPFGTNAVVDRSSVGSALTATAKGLRLETDAAQLVTVDIYDILGRPAYSTVLRNIGDGTYVVDDIVLPAGAYMARAAADGRTIGQCRLIR